MFEPHRTSLLSRTKDSLSTAMKSRQNSPQPEIVHVSAVRVDTRMEPPRMRFDDMLGPTMTGFNSFGLVDQENMPPKQALSSSPGSGKQMGDAFIARSRTPLSAFQPPHTTDAPPIFPRLSPSLSAGSIADSSTSNTPDGLLQSPTWSSAVGRATTGKSGRVIERLQGENDRLKRELKLETLRREEEQKKGEIARGKMESLQATNDNLVQMRDVDRTSLARKERKVEELRSDLEFAKAKRLEAEIQLKGIMTESERVEADLRSQLREETEKARRATSQYELLSSSWKQLDEGYRRKTDLLKKDMAKLTRERAEDSGKLERLEIIIEQQRQEVEKMTAAKDGAVKQFDAFKRETDESTRLMRERAERNEKANSETLAQTLQVLGEMRHVINVRKFVKEIS